MATCRAPAYGQNAWAFALGTVLWILCFFGSWHFFSQWHRVKQQWEEWGNAKRYLLSSLPQSSLHGIIVPFGILVCLSQCGIWGDWLANSCTQIEIVFALTASYFTVDSVLIVYYQGEQWQIFLVHHVVGSMPFFINCFGCSNLHFLVGAGILIEAICPLLNLRHWLRIFGHWETRASALVFVATYVGWIFLRVALPLYLTVGLFTVAIPSLKGEIVDWAIVPSYITGTSITGYKP